jgi:very-short-patch-repair endonuclease
MDTQDKPTLDFIKKAIKLHGFEYDYSKVKYVNAHAKVTIGCKIHGDFDQSPNGHLCKDIKNGGGRGCKECGLVKSGLARRKNTQWFVSEAKKVHGDAYDYSKVKYVTSIDNITIICQKEGHGPFEQQPNNHLQGKKCSKCAGVYKPNTNEFIERSILIHGKGIYDYSKSEYIDSKTPLIIICPKEGHGEFLQAPSNHYLFGCSKCGYEKLAESKTLTTDEFKQRAIEKHGDTYDYNDTLYIGMNLDLNMICKTHGVFKQIAGVHLSGGGCSKCGGCYKRNTEEFIQEAVKLHCDIYDYSKVEYKTCKDYVTIICKKHGPFVQTPDIHLNNKAGCQICSNERNALRMSDTQEDFLRKAVEVHGDTFDYSKVNYIDSQTYVTIICQEIGHGEFPQVPSSHLQGTGCIKCSGTYQFDTNEFKERAVKKHGNKYDYSKVDYVNCQAKVIIGCKEHGDFEQLAGQHLSGKGCRICGGSAPLNLEIAIEKFKLKHGDLYDYSKCKYVNCSTNMSIICKKHGEFQQTYDNHSRGTGCPSCLWKTEGKLYERLKQCCPNVERQFKADWCKNKTHLPFDFCIPEYKIIIELDGAQHFKQICNWSSPEVQFKNDIYKQTCANTNGYSVIRLLQEDVLNDTYDWFNELCNVIDEVQILNYIKNIYLCKNNEYINFSSQIT